MIKYSDLLCKWLKELGYTHCFYLAGGNIMHLLESASRSFTCITTVHEVAAGIAAEYLNETETDKKAFVLVTAGPGLTNVVTAMAGAFLESRELLVIGGQVKTTDLCDGSIRQKGIQEIDGVQIVKPITKEAVRLDKPIIFAELSNYVNISKTPRKGPVFIEIPLDVQASKVEESKFCIANQMSSLAVPVCSPERIELAINKIRAAKRPIILLGGGISRKHIDTIYQLAQNQSLPMMTTWNATDRLGSDHHLYFGRPNTWGMRYSNILLQQADLLVAVGTRLGMQQTGFNWQKFMPKASIIQVDCDQAELDKGHPKVDIKIRAEAGDFITKILTQNLGQHTAWLNFCNHVKSTLPTVEECNKTGDDFLSPYYFHQEISKICTTDDVVIACSSGSAFTVTMQAFMQKKGQILITNKGLASMGYGLSGAIGAAIAMSPKRTLLFEGDGGFAQNIQELGTAKSNNLNLKIFIFDDNGYASIRMTQRNYFGGKYMGCDNRTNLGLPSLKKLFAVYEIECLKLERDFIHSPQFLSLFNSSKIAAFIVPIDEEQTYFPKITSRITTSGSMESNPLHLMSPPLPLDIMKSTCEFIDINEEEYKKQI